MDSSVEARAFVVLANPITVLPPSTQPSCRPRVSDMIQPTLSSSPGMTRVGCSFWQQPRLAVCIVGDGCYMYTCTVYVISVEAQRDKFQVQKLCKYDIINPNNLGHLCIWSPRLHMCIYNPQEYICTYHPQDYICTYHPQHFICSYNPQHYICSYNPQHFICSYNPQHYICSYNPQQYICSYNPQHYICSYNPQHIELFI